MRDRPYCGRSGGTASARWAASAPCPMPTPTTRSRSATPPDTVVVPELPTDGRPWTSCRPSAAAPAPRPGQDGNLIVPAQMQGAPSGRGAVRPRLGWAVWEAHAADFPTPTHMGERPARAGAAPARDHRDRWILCSIAGAVVTGTAAFLAGRALPHAAACRSPSGTRSRPQGPSRPRPTKAGIPPRCTRGWWPAATPYRPRAEAGRPRPPPGPCCSTLNRASGRGASGGCVGRCAGVVGGIRADASSPPKAIPQRGAFLIQASSTVWPATAPHFFPRTACGK